MLRALIEAEQSPSEMAQLAQRRMRQKLRSPAGRKVYGRRKAVVEPVLGVLKQQRGMRQFQTRGLAKVAIEFTLAALAYNLTRVHHRR